MHNVNLIMLGATTIDAINEAEDFIISLTPNIQNGNYRAKLIAQVRAQCAFQRAEIYRRSMYNMYTLGNHVEARRYLNLMHREFQIAADWCA